MFQHMFTSMNEMLDGIVELYPEATDQERLMYNEQVCELKKLNDAFIESWLQFEEKVSDFQELFGEQIHESKDLGEVILQLSPPEQSKTLQSSSKAISCNEGDIIIPDDVADKIKTGQGYYNLFMFSRAASIFNEAITVAPECNLARLFLGMSQMHMQNWNEAQRHFQLLIVLSDFPKWLALGYNALGCIQAVHMNMAQAEKLFSKAYETYPTFTDSLNNLKSCQETPGQLSLYFGSTELCCL
ncbi:hypothetical protein I6N90_08895 [Paenibacillus sp. GSMTC-2017]|uniref:hypothetical protein n=1 Tax=Paenibacillus sp. GSMTC-2017 TaxID=2794350 RepID=UPI0018D61BED|nr:hypothetical protein [Paenibacillus sp. GSMTC-2017]MBH5317919.1 hypothetical protein [Paenibacillus sp. GSMTC-2017]